MESNGTTNSMKTYLNYFRREHERKGGCVGRDVTKDLHTCLPFEGRHAPKVNTRCLSNPVYAQKPFTRSRTLEFT